MENTKYQKLLDAYNLYRSREFEEDDTFTLDDLVNSNGILGVLYTDYEGYSDIQLNYDVYHECYLYYYGENAAKCDPTCLIHTEKIPLEVAIEDLSIGDYDGFYQAFGNVILRYKPISSLE